MSTVLAVTNQKGGVGKTTTVCSLAGVLSLRGRRVLAVDLDPQGNLSFSLGADDQGITLHDVLKGSATLQDAVQHTPNCDVIPSNILLSGLELELKSEGREFVLKKTLADCLDQYDFILLDTPPALSILTINAYTACGDLLIPMIPEILSLQGINQLEATIMAVKKYFNPSMNIRGILLTKYNERVLLHQEVEEMAQIVADRLDTRILDTKISAGVAVAEAPAHQKTLARYAPGCRPSKEYCALAKELYGV